MLLAHFRDSPDAGGSLRVGQTLALALRRRGVQAELCFGYGGVGPVGREGGARCHYLRLRGSHDVLHWSRFRRLIHRIRPHIVHFIDPSVWMHAMAAGTGVKKVLHVHGIVFQEPTSRRHRIALRFVSRQADRFVCITHGVRDSVVRHGLAPAARATVVYNAIDFDMLQRRPGRREARQHLGLPDDARIIGMVCRLVDARGCDDLLRMLPMLGAEWHALLVGDGPARSRLERLALMLGVRDRVWFIGSLADVRPAYSAMDAYAFLALYDSFGLATAEAMACRVPVFGLAGEGEFREPQNPLVTPSNAVFLERIRRHVFEQEEDESVLRALAERIAHYGQRPSTLAPVIETAWHHVRTRFSTDVQCEDILSVYGRVLEMTLDRPPLAATTTAWQGRT